MISRSSKYSKNFYCLLSSFPFQQQAKQRTLIEMFYGSKAEFAENAEMFLRSVGKEQKSK
jgi:hypothetical protein